MSKPLPCLLREDQEHLLQIARKAIQRKGKGLTDLGADLISGSPLLSPQAVFVTLFEGENLRGCIGHLRPDLPVWESVARMACEAAFHDPRFEEVTADELPRIRIEISILTDPTEVKSVEEIVPGRDGLIIEGKGRRGLLLPQVAEKRDWDVATFLEQTCWKAGLNKDAWKEKGVRIMRFEALVFGETEDRGTPGEPMDEVRA